MEYFTYSFSRYFDRVDYKITAARNVHRFLSVLFENVTKERRKDVKDPNCVYYQYAIYELGQFVAKYVDIPNPPIEICMLNIYLGETKVHKDRFHIRVNVPGSEEGIWFYEEKWRTAHLMMNHVHIREYDRYKTTLDETPSYFYTMERDGVLVRNAKTNEEEKLRIGNVPRDIYEKVTRIIMEFENRMPKIPKLQDVSDGNEDDEFLILSGRKLREACRKYNENKVDTAEHNQNKEKLYQEFDQYMNYVYQSLMKNPKSITRRNLPFIIYDDTGNFMIDGSKTSRYVQVYWKYQKEEKPVITDLIRTNLDLDYCGTGSYLYKILTTPKTFLLLAANGLIGYLKPSGNFDDITKASGLPWYPVEEIKELPSFETSENISYDIKAHIFAAAHEYEYMLDPEFTIGLWLQKSPQKVAAALTDEYKNIFSGF